MSEPEVIIPLKGLASVKSRLGPVLPDRCRERLVVAMALDLIELLAGQSFLGPVCALVGAGWDGDALRSAGASVLPEDASAGGDLNKALMALESRRRRASRLVLHGDLPYVTTTELHELAQRLTRFPLVLIPDAHARGTNGMAYREGCAPAFRFGRDSFPAHVQAAMRRGVTWDSLAAPALAQDIDTPTDLQRLLASNEVDGSDLRAGPRVRRWVRERRGVLAVTQTPSANPRRSAYGGPAGVPQ